MADNKYGLDYEFEFRTVRYEDRDALKRFVCEEGAIADFIHNESLDSERDITYLFIDKENGNVICYCSICCNGITVLMDSGTGEYNTNIPAIEIDFFAIDERYRGIKFDAESGRYDTLSRVFFFYMIEKIKEISGSVVGAEAVCLYAVPQAVSFYKRCGFSEFEQFMVQDTKPFIEGCIPMFYLL